MLRLKYLYLMLRHRLFFFLSGKDNIKVEKLGWPKNIAIIESKWFIWWIPTDSFNTWRKNEILKKLKKL